MVLCTVWKTAGGAMYLADAVPKAEKDSPLAMSCIKNNSLKKFRFPSRISYSLVASKGKKLRLEVLNLKALSAPDTCARFCFIVKKKNGSAVFRNRCRRILRNIFFETAKNFKNPLWIMIIVEMNENNANWEELRESAKCAISLLNA
jgi:ribonuclease P protein component